MEDYKKSEFNEASLKMQRVHELQKLINICSLDKLAIYYGEDSFKLPFATTKRNYEIIFNAACQLLQEVYPKLDDEEVKEILIKKKVLNEAIKKFRVVTTFNQARGNLAQVLDVGTWDWFEDKLFEFDTKIRMYLDVHGISGRNLEDDDGL